MLIFTHWINIFFYIKPYDYDSILHRIHQYKNTFITEVLCHSNNENVLELINIVDNKFVKEKKELAKI